MLHIFLQKQGKNHAFKKIQFFYYNFFGCAGSSLPRGVSVVAVMGEGVLSSGGTQASHCGGFSHCRAWALG